MNRQPSRRRVKKRKNPAANSRMKFSGFLGIMILAVFLGYLTARFVVGPVIGYDASESPAKIAEEAGEKDSETDSEKDSEKDAGADSGDSSADDTSGGDTSEETSLPVTEAPDDGYALQFGVFSSKDSAEELAVSLKSQGIDTEIIKVDDVYKVISPVLDTKEDALAALSALPDTGVTDVFVASFQ